MAPSAHSRSGRRDQLVHRGDRWFEFAFLQQRVRSQQKFCDRGGRGRLGGEGFVPPARPPHLFGDHTLVHSPSLASRLRVSGLLAAGLRISGLLGIPRLLRSAGLWISRLLAVPRLLGFPGLWIAKRLGTPRLSWFPGLWVAMRLETSPYPRRVSLMMPGASSAPECRVSFAD